MFRNDLEIHLHLGNRTLGQNVSGSLVDFTDFPKGDIHAGNQIWDDLFGIFWGPCKASPRNPGILCFDSGRAWGLGSGSCGESVCAKWVGISRYEGQMIHPFHVVNNYLNCDLHQKSDAVYLKE